MAYDLQSEKIAFLIFSYLTELTFVEFLIDENWYIAEDCSHISSVVRTCTSPFIKFPRNISYTHIAKLNLVLYKLEMICNRRDMHKCLNAAAWENIFEAMMNANWELTIYHSFMFLVIDWDKNGTKLFTPSITFLYWCIKIFNVKLGIS